MNRIVLLSLVVLSPVGTIGTVGFLAPLEAGSSVGLLSVVGSKVSRTEARTIKEFDCIDFSGLESVWESVWQSVCIYETASSLEDAAGENLLNLVETVVEDLALKLRFTNSSSMRFFPEASSSASIASAGEFAMDSPSSGETGFDWAACRKTSLNRKSRFKMPRDGFAFASCCYANSGVLSARNGIRSYPRQPRVSNTVVESGTVDRSSCAVISVCESDNESNDPAGETESDEEDDR